MKPINSAYSVLNFIGGTAAAMTDVTHADKGPRKAGHKYNPDAPAKLLRQYRKRYSHILTGIQR